MRVASWLIIFSLAICASTSALAQALPDNVRSAGVTVAQWQEVQSEVRRAAAARGASERALAAVAARVSVNLIQGGRIDLDLLLRSIDERAQQVAQLQGQLSVLERADDPEITQLLAQARVALDVGDLQRSDEFLRQAADSDLAAISRDRARLVARQTRAARTMAERGQLALLGAAYLDAAALYARAAETLPAEDRDTRWLYRMYQASAVTEYARTFGDLRASAEAVRLYRESVLPLVSRETRPLDWAGTQNDLGTALTTLGMRGDPAAIQDALAAYRAALSVVTFNNAPAQWASTQYNLGIALGTLGRRGDDTSLRAGIAALRAAVSATDRTRSPLNWAHAQTQLGDLLIVLGRRGERAAFAQAAEAYRAALEVITRENAPSEWAAIQSLLGHAYYSLGGSDDTASLQASVGAYRSALQTLTRERNPVDWANAQDGLGQVLLVLAARGDPQAHRDAIAAFESALTVRTREAMPADWAKTQFNLALAYVGLIVTGDRRQVGPARIAASAAIEGYEIVGDRAHADEARRLLAAIERN